MSPEQLAYVKQKYANDPNVLALLGEVERLGDIIGQVLDEGRKVGVSHPSLVAHKMIDVLEDNGFRLFG